MPAGPAVALPLNLPVEAAQRSAAVVRKMLEALEKSAQAVDAFLAEVATADEAEAVTDHRASTVNASAQAPLDMPSGRDDQLVPRKVFFRYRLLDGERPCPPNQGSAAQQSSARARVAVTAISPNESQFTCAYYLNLTARFSAALRCLVHKARAGSLLTETPRSAV